MSGQKAMKFRKNPLTENTEIDLDNSDSWFDIINT